MHLSAWNMAMELSVPFVPLSEIDQNWSFPLGLPYASFAWQRHLVAE